MHMYNWGGRVIICFILSFTWAYSSSSIFSKYVVQTSRELYPTTLPLTTGKNGCEWEKHIQMTHILGDCRVLYKPGNPGIVFQTFQGTIIHTLWKANWRSSSPVLLSVSLSEGWWTGVEFGVASPLTTWLRAGLQELEGTWPSTPLEAEQEPDLGPKSVPFTEL